MYFSVSLGVPLSPCPSGGGGSTEKEPGLFGELA